MNIEDDIDELEQAIAGIEDALASLDIYKVDFGEQLEDTKRQMQEQLEVLQARQQEEWDKEFAEQKREYWRDVI